MRILITLICLVSYSHASDIAVFSLDKVLLKSNSWNLLKKKTKSSFVSLENEIKYHEVKIKSLFHEIESLRKSRSIDNNLVEKEKEFEKLNKEVNKFVNFKKTKINNKFEQEKKNIYSQIDNIIKTILKQKKYKIIINVDHLSTPLGLYYTDKIDITNAIISKINKKHLN